MKLLIVIVGMFAIGNAQIMFRVAPMDPFVAPMATLVSAVAPKEIPEAELADWEAYKEKFSKVYMGVEDRLRRNIFFANKEKVAKYDELLSHNTGFEKLQLDIFADQTRDEIFSLRSKLEESQDEWNNYKLKFGKLYDSYADKFHKTIYFIVKDLIMAHNQLAAFGLAPNAVAINMYTDFFYDELPSSSYIENSIPTIALTRAAYLF